MRDILLDEGEYIEACRKLNEFSNDLMVLIQRYTEVLNRMEASALKEEQINSKLKGIASKVRVQTVETQNILEELTSVIVEVVGETEAADDFRFPY